MATEKVTPHLGLSKNRAEALSDGIFAFAMTLLVLGMEVPEPAGGYASAEAVSAILASIYPDLTHYMTAFVMLASFWMLHHRCYDRIKVIDRRMLWMNFATLLFVALVPFSTDLADSYVSSPLAGMVFSLNILIVGTFLYLQWSYASRSKHVISETVTPEEVAAIKRKMLIMPGIAIFAIALAFFGIPWTVMIYLLAPALFMIIK